MVYKNKKGFSTAGIVWCLVAVALFFAFTPVFANLVAQADESVLGCSGATPILNVSESLCTNASGVTVVNATPENIGLSTSDSTLLGLATLFIILGIIFTVWKLAQGGS